MTEPTSQDKPRPDMIYPNPDIKLKEWLRHSIMARVFAMGFLILVLLVPLEMVRAVIVERENRQSEVSNEIASKWGQAQTVKGLVLTVPYKVYTKEYEPAQDPKKPPKYKIIETIHQAHFLPDSLKIEGSIKPEVRYRSIYEVVVYNGDVRIAGAFPQPNFSDLNIPAKDVLWKDATVTLGLSDLRGIQKNVSVTWGGKPHPFNPGTPNAEIIASGVQARVPIQAGDKGHPFQMSLNFNGSWRLYFVPLGKETNVTLTSPWADPSFDGAFLPDDRKIEKDGFRANWNVLHVNRGYPQVFKSPVEGMDESAFGLSLVVPVDQYQKSMRSVKYGILFISLTFLVFFFVQLLNPVRIHPIQYLLVGFALCLFYLLLISLSEHIPFQLAYLAASVAIVALITAYTRTMFRQGAITVIMGLILAILYGFIYTLIQLQDHALLLGSLGLFVILALVMYFSRNIDWYAIGQGPQESGAGG